VQTEQPTVAPGDEIACDESGWEGANLVAGRSDVIAYASVRLSVDAAAECLRELGGRVGHLTREYKASHVLRADRRSTVSLLGQGGPVHGNAFIHLTEKTYFVVGRVLDLLLGQSADAASAGLVVDRRLTGLATTLSREGPEAFGPDRWRAFLAASNAVLRTRKPRRVRREPMEAFMDLVETLADLNGNSRVGAILDELRKARSVAVAARERILENHVLRPPLEPLIPALASTVLHWSHGGETDVAIVHDEQSALTERRIRRLERQLLPPGRFLRFRQVDSRTDPRVQVADVLAGVARRLATDELHGRGDAELGGLLRAYVDPASRWSDERSWSRLSPLPL
jgi:hypothetical protein